MRSKASGSRPSPITVVTAWMDFPSKGGLVILFLVEVALVVFVFFVLMPCVFSAHVVVFVFGLYPAAAATADDEDHRRNNKQKVALE